MNASFDGMRRNATRSMNKLHDILKDILEEYDLYEHHHQSLIEAFNNAAQNVDMFNCLYDDEVQGDVNNLSDLSIDRLDDLEEED